MGTRFLVLVLFILAMVSSSALTVLYLNKSSETIAGSVDEDTVGKLVSDYIENNPQVILDGIQKAQAQQRNKEAAQAAKNVKQVTPQIESSKAIAGNPKGDVTFAIFHDYNCGFCRKAIPDIQKLIKEDKNVKIVLKDLPILGQKSRDKGSISTAVQVLAPEKAWDAYVKISEKNPKNDAQMDAILEEIGLDVAVIREKAKSPEIENLISENRSIATKVGIRGTPAFIVGEQLVRGAVGFDRFKATVDSERAKN